MSASLRLANEAYRLALNYAENPPIAPSALICARNDRAAFQAIVQSDRQYSVNVSQEEWFTDERPTVWPHDRLRLTAECDLPVTLNIVEYVRDDDVQKTDLILEQSVRESAANLPTAVWCEICAPADAEPGEYGVTVSLYSSLPGEDEVFVDRRTVTLTVANYHLPDPKEWGFYLNLWQHSSNIARKSDVALWSDAHFEVLEAYMKSLAALGQKSITVVAAQIPWSGWACYADRRHHGNLFEYSMIRAFRSSDGAFRYDYSPMQRYIDLCTRLGFSGKIEVFGLSNVWRAGDLFDQLCPEYPDDVRVRYLDEADGRMKYMRNAEEIDDYIRSLERYFIRTGQIDRVRIAADEPSKPEKYKAALDHLHEIAPSFRCATAINHAEFIERFHRDIDVAAPHITCAAREWETLLETKRKYPEKTILWYVCVAHSARNARFTPPNQHIRCLLTESRAVGIMTEALGFDGFLRWDYTVWNADPRADLRTHLWESGDTCFVYPGHNGKPLLSLRYKNLQRGLADHALLQELKRAKGEDAARRLLGTMIRFRDADGLKRIYDGERAPDELFDPEWEAFNDFKRALLDQLANG